MVGIRSFPFGMAYLQGRTVSFREGTQNDGLEKGKSLLKMAIVGINSLVFGDVHSLKLKQLTWHLKIDSWKTRPSFWVSAYFQGRNVSFREVHFISGKNEVTISECCLMLLPKKKINLLLNLCDEITQCMYIYILAGVV